MRYRDLRDQRLGRGYRLRQFAAHGPGELFMNFPADSIANPESSAA